MQIHTVKYPKMNEEGNMIPITCRLCFSFSSSLCWVDVLYLCISIYLTQLFRGICRSNAGIPISTRMTCNLLHIHVHLQIQMSNIMRAISYRGITYHHLVLGGRLEVSISARRYGSASLQYNLFTANRISSTSLP